MPIGDVCVRDVVIFSVRRPIEMSAARFTNAQLQIARTMTYPSCSGA